MSMTFEKNEDKRSFHRIFYNAEAVLEGEGVRHARKIVDLSLKGCLLEFSESWQADEDTLYTLSLYLTSEISIVMTVSLKRTAGTQLGFQCRHIDIDSISRLRRLVELNLGDSELLERELAALSGSAVLNSDNF